MDEKEWKEWWRHDDSEVMRQDFRLEATERKVRLFAVACCRRVWHLLTDERSRRAVEIAEKFADGLASDSQRAEAHRAAEDAQQAAEMSLGENRDDFHSPVSVIYHAAHAARLTSEKDCRLWLDDVARSIFDVVTCESDGSDEAENEAHCHLLRDLFNPFSPVVDSTWLSWNGGTVPRLAQAIYNERTFNRLPILADALEEAGCTNADILGHCRQPGDHVRGCWVVDLLLGKK